MRPCAVRPWAVAAGGLDGEGGGSRRSRARIVPGHRGEQVHIDEYIGTRRFRMRGVAIESVPGQAITWQVHRLVRLPVRLRLLVDDDGHGGVEIRHTISAGWRGLGAALDPVWRLLWFRPSGRPHRRPSGRQAVRPSGRQAASVK